jgi:hypothetical protein
VTAPTPAARPLGLHASCVCIGEAGVLVRGASGAGKTALCQALIALAGATGRFARLVADDRLFVRARHGRLLAAPHPATAGLAEWRGLGLAPEPHLPAARISLVVDLGPEPPRLPEPADLVVAIAGVTVPRLSASRGAADAGLVWRALELLVDPA